jgi:hypothetical protein
MRPPDYGIVCTENVEFPDGGKQTVTYLLEPPERSEDE